MRVSTVLLMVSTAAWCSAAPMQMPPQLPGLPGLNITDTVTIILSANKHRDTSSIQALEANLELRADVSDEEYARDLEPRADSPTAVLIRRDGTDAPPPAEPTPDEPTQQQPPRRSLTERDDLALP
jgi:hypothetical protein